MYNLILIAVLLLSSSNSFAQAKNLISQNINEAELPANKRFEFPNATDTKAFLLNLAALNEKDIFELSLFNGQNIQFQFSKMYHYTNGASSWYGKSVQGNGDVIISFYQGNVHGIIIDDFNKKYMLQQINTTQYFVLSKVDNTLLKEAPEGVKDYIEDSSPHKKSRANADVCAIGSTCVGNSTIDIMVLGAAQAIIDGGGNVPAFTVNATSAVTEMNTAISNSGGAAVTFNLIHCDATAFVTSNDLSGDLSAFSADAGVQALRNTHYADLVSLWSGSGSYAGFCGIGYLNSNATNYSANAAYNVCDYGCAMTNLSFAHECGHNMGLRHDYYVDNALSPCDHHHGYINQTVIPTGLPAPARWRTIMAYNNQCSDNGFYCDRLPRWSNPTLNIAGDATGIAIGMPLASDEMYGFARFSCVVSTFRNNPLPVTMLSFNAKANTDKIFVEWATTNEINNKGFDIEIKKEINDDFYSIGWVNAKTNSGTDNQYNFLSEKMNAGTYYIRLNQKDIDNKNWYSEIIKVEIGTNGLQTSLYPNPAKNNFTINMFNPKNQNISIGLYDMLGNKVIDILNQNMLKGDVKIMANTTGVAKGIYFCKIETANEKVVSKMIIE